MYADKVLTPDEEFVVVHMTAEEAACIHAALTFEPTAGLIRQTTYWPDVESLTAALGRAVD